MLNPITSALKNFVPKPKPDLKVLLVPLPKEQLDLYKEAIMQKDKKVSLKYKFAEQTPAGERIYLPELTTKVIGSEGGLKRVSSEPALSAKDKFVKTAGQVSQVRHGVDDGIALGKTAVDTAKALWEDASKHF